MQVYWNSRMSAERGRVAAKCGPGEVVLDLCCGVGAFALLCARLDLAIPVVKNSYCLARDAPYQ